MIDKIKASLTEMKTAFDKLLSDDETIKKIESAADILIETYRDSCRVFSCGNGGSMCDAMHFAEELSGRYRKDRKGYPAIAISDPGYLTCASNDFGYDFVFSRYIVSNGKKGDCLVAISTSGTSPNILNAVKSAIAMGIKVIFLTGHMNEDIENLSDVCICTPGGDFADRIQELQIKVLHILIEMTERHFHPENY
jgi:D-sedoheptulose 7-phosphate isomerase